jgi:hypothetical protein
MTTPPSLDERVTALEDAVFGIIPLREPSNRATAEIHAEIAANGEAIAGLRIAMAAVQTGIVGELCALKATLNLRCDCLRKELGVATAGFRADVTGLRETTGMRFQKVDGQFKGLHAEINQRFDAIDRRFDAIDAKLDAILTELLSPAR